MYAYFIDISQGSIDALMVWWDIDNHITAHCLQSVPVKKFWKSVNNWQRYGQK